MNVLDVVSDALKFWVQFGVVHDVLPVWTELTTAAVSIILEDEMVVETKIWALEFYIVRVNLFPFKWITKVLLYKLEQLWVS